MLDTMSLARENLHWLSCTRKNMYCASLSSQLHQSTVLKLHFFQLQLELELISGNKDMYYRLVVQNISVRLL